MSANNKRCTSGTIPSARSHSLSSIKPTSTFSRSKTCGVSPTVLLKSKPERLQPLTTNKPAPVDDQTLVYYSSPLNICVCKWIFSSIVRRYQLSSSGNGQRTLFTCQRLLDYTEFISGNPMTFHMKLDISQHLFLWN